MAPDAEKYTDEVMHFCAPAALCQQIRDLAKAEERSQSVIIRRLLDRALEATSQQGMREAPEAITAGLDACDAILPDDGTAITVPLPSWALRKVRQFFSASQASAPMITSPSHTYDPDDYRDLSAGIVGRS